MGAAEEAREPVLSERWGGSADEVREVSRRLLLAGLHQQQLAEDTEQARRRLTLLLEASTILAESRTANAGLEGVARLVVPWLADTCLIEVVLDGSHLRHAVGDPSGLSELAATVMRPRSARLVSDVDDLPPDAGDADEFVHRRLHALGIRSYIVVPLLVGGRILGALTLLAAK